MNELNIAPLFETLRKDVEHAMTVLGFQTCNTKSMPTVCVGTDLTEMGLTPQGEKFAGGYDPVTNTIHIPFDVFCDPDKLHAVMAHELAHSHQDEQRIAREFLYPYNLRECEKEAFQTQMYITGLTYNHRAVSKLTPATVLTKTYIAWVDAMFD